MKYCGKAPGGGSSRGRAPRGGEPVRWLEEGGLEAVVEALHGAEEAFAGPLAVAAAGGERAEADPSQKQVAPGGEEAANPQWGLPPVTISPERARVEGHHDDVAHGEEGRAGPG